MLNKGTVKVLEQLIKHNYNFEKVSTNNHVALNDTLLGAHCSITAIKLVDKCIPRKGDILIGFYAFEAIEFTLKVNELLPYHVYARLGTREPKPFQPIRHAIPKNQFVFAYTKESSDYVINMIGMQYNSVIMNNFTCNKLNLLCFYGYLQTEERKKLTVRGESLLHVFPSLENRMVVKIQRQWRESISNPSFQVCRSRLLNELKQM